jgi:hypothetical protein
MNALLPGSVATKTGSGIKAATAHIPIIERSPPALESWTGAGMEFVILV